MHGLLEPGFAAERLDELKRCAHLVERRNLEQLNVVEPGHHTFVLIFAEQRFHHGASLWPELSEDIALAHLVGALASGERRLVESDVANEVKRVEIFADLFHQRAKQQPFFSQLFDHSVFARFAIPTP